MAFLGEEVWTAINDAPSQLEIAVARIPQPTEDLRKIVLKIHINFPGPSGK